MIGKRWTYAPAQCLVLARLVHLADELDSGVVVDERGDGIRVVVPILGINLGRDHYSHPGIPRDLDRPVNPLLGADPNKEDKVAAGVGA
ncbi:MAG: hypothetical protein M3Z19_15820 [Chloroflexota bacterium]|nr:hypothetical protein [Chloroflexota bacterium]